MKLHSILLLATLAGLLAVVALAADETSNELQGPTTTEVVEKPSLDRVMSFEFYKQKYNKQYANAAEMARRAKLFMARAFRVFISSIKYLYKRASKFLKINPHSDWTEAERDVITMDDRSGPGNKTSYDKDDIGRLLAEDPKFASILDVQRNEHKRKRRNVETRSMKAKRERKLAVDDLIGEPQPKVEMPAKYAPSVPSNNPDYEQPQVFSEGAQEEGEQVEPIPEEEAAKLDKSDSSQGGYLSSLTQGIKSVYGYLTKDDLADLDEELDRKYKLEENRFEEESDGDDDDYYEEEEEEDEYEGEPDEMYLDYRDTGCLLQPKDQKACGSCYAFTAMALMEYHHCRQRGKLVPFSEQYIIDCAPGRMKHLEGCNGGRASEVGFFVNKYGLELSADYPYRAKELTCPYHSGTSSRHMGHSKIDDLEVVMLEEEEYLGAKTIAYLLENKGPLFISIFTGADFSDFGGGVDHLRCDPEKPYGHAMVLVGHGREDGVDYWLIRNSHGVSYGLQGHYKLAKDVPVECVLRVGYVRGQFKRNKSHKGKALFNELKRQNLLANFA